MEASQLQAEVGISLVLGEAVEGPRVVMPDGCPVALIQDVICDLTQVLSVL